MADPHKTNEILLGLLSCAFGGGSNYWYASLEKDSPPRGTPDSSSYWHWCQEYPVFGGSVQFVADDEPDEVLTLDRAALDKGWEIFRTNHVRRYADAISENSDTTTGDVFLQVCVFGEKVYG